MTRASWTLTFDATSPRVLAAFWAAALHYEELATPPGFASWDDWFDHYDVPLDERDGVRAIVDPAGVLPQISFLAVPEGKSAKNKLHLDIQAGGGRDEVPYAERWAKLPPEVARLTALGATELATVTDDEGNPDHVVMADPEGNEFCVV